MIMTRAATLERVWTEARWDLVVIGGGATGLGTALDAATRGYSTLLLEAFDFAKGTSSRSTKLVHGGVRYLAQGRLGLVREALHERGRLLENAPHLVRPLAFVVPAYSRWSMPYYGLGLKLYDLLAGSGGLGPSRTISRAEARLRAPTLEPQGLRGGTVYFDAQFDDARLAIALLRSLLDRGGAALNYAPVTGLVKRGDRVAGVRVRDAETGEELELSARAVVNATGVYADAVRLLDDRRAPPMIAPSQGIHLVLDRSFLPGDTAVLVPGTDDGRVLFAIPWHGRVLVGTTDTPVDRLPIEPRPQAQEVEFLLDHAARYFRPAPRAEDICSLFAGLRPLVRAGPSGRSTARLSRGHALIVSPSGLVTITGGKWTSYRLMGADAVDRAAEVAGLLRVPCRTATLPLHGWLEAPAADTRHETTAERPFSVYGSDAQALRRLLTERPEWDEPLHPALPYRAGEVVWATRYEMARTVEDVLARRTRALILDARASLAAAPRVAEILAAELGRDPAWRRDQVRQFDELARGYLPPSVAGDSRSSPDPIG
jgi:glycerol-3-phosphate dehydrogenase